MPYYRCSVRSVKSLLGDRSGAAAVEYGLLIAAFAGLILFALFFLGNLLNSASAGVTGAGSGTQAGVDGGTFIHSSPDAQ
jgi:Flp pilus assembly pilin Flp